MYKRQVHASSSAEDPWHPEQEIKKLDNGDVQLTIPDVTHELEIMPLLLALGHEAEILKPEEIRDSMAKVAQAMVAMYQN